MIIALASPRVATSLEDGLEKIDRLLAEASEQGAEIACFPEAYLPGLRGQDFAVLPFDPATQEAVLQADLVIGAVLVPGAAAPKLVTRDMVRAMKRGSVIVDVAVDQGGCVETTHATTHAAPTYVVDGVVHYCVANMPGAVSRTSTQALTNATLPWVLRLAKHGSERLAAAEEGFRLAVNTRAGRLLNRAVGEAHGIQVSAS